MHFPHPRRRPRAGRFLLTFAWAFICMVFLGLNATAAAAQGIQGQVTDDLSAPIAGAIVRAEAGPSAGRQVTTGVNGFFVLTGIQPGEYIFSARRPGFTRDLRRVTVVPAGITPVNFTLVPIPATPEVGIVEGIVSRAGTSNRVPGARVVLVGATGFSETLTNDSGIYRFENVPAGTYRIQVSRVGFIGQTRTGVRVQANRITRANFDLRVRGAELGILEGLVTDTVGTPVRGARVLITTGASRGQGAVTNTQGFYRINQVVPGGMTVRVRADGFDEGVGIVEVAPGLASTLNFTLVGAIVGDATIQGFVRDLLGQPIPGALVEVTLGPGAGRFAVAGPDGFYRLSDLGFGTHTLSVSATGYFPEGRQVPLQPGEVSEELVTLGEDASTLLGSIFGQVTRNGTPVPDAVVTITEGPVVGRQSAADGEGRYVLPNLPEGTYTLAAEAEGTPERTVPGVQVFSRQATQADVELITEAVPGELSGVVRDTLNDPLANVTVVVREDGAQVAQTQTNAQGAYQFASLPAGLYDVEFTLAGFDTVTRTNVQIVGGEVTTLNVQLQETEVQPGAVAGFVHDAAGRAIAGAVVGLTGPDVDRRQLTNAAGRFRFENVPPGSGYSLRVAARGMIGRTITNFTVRSGQVTSFNILLRVATGRGGVAGRVQTAIGLPLVGATVTVVEGPATGNSATTNFDGRYNLTGLPAGEYVLEAEAQGYHPAQVTVVIVAEQTTIANIVLLRLNVPPV
jgi:large repetitive protein